MGACSDPPRVPATATPATTTVIVGAGLGGLAVAQTLRRLLADAAHKIILIDKSDTHTVCATLQWVMTGERTLQEVTHDKNRLISAGVEFVHAEVLEISAANQEVVTSKGTVRGDYLVLALGADYNWNLIPGIDSAHTFYTAAGASKLRDALASFQGGHIMSLIPKVPIKCPPAAYETMMLIDEMLIARGIRSKATLSIYTCEGSPMAAAGPEAGANIKEMIAKKEIAFHPAQQSQKVDQEKKCVVFKDGQEVPFDLLVVVPPHQAPKVVVDAGLTNQAGYIPVDPASLRVLSSSTGQPASTETKVAPSSTMYAVGDVTTLTLPGRFKPDVPLALPKAGLFAIKQGRCHPTFLS
jgi:sulfide:quinone oxidoreductase